jgi:hypothetical protein
VPILPHVEGGGRCHDPKIKLADTTVNRTRCRAATDRPIEQRVKAQLSTARAEIKVTVDVATRRRDTTFDWLAVAQDVLKAAHDGKHLRQERVYQRTVADQNGAPIAREHLAFVKAAKTTSDTRLAPDEKRAETFYFDIPPGVQAQVKATFWYYFSPTATAETEKRVTFLTISRLAR